MQHHWRRRALAAALSAAVVLGLAGKAGADVLAATSPAAFPAVASAGPSCDGVLATAAASAPATVPPAGWATWWATSPLSSARTSPACTTRTVVAEPRWRGQVAFSLAMTRSDLSPLVAWLLGSSFAPSTVVNPVAATLDVIAERARAATPTCALPPGLLASLAWLGEPSLLDGQVPVTDDGRWVGAPPTGFAPLWAALGLPLNDPVAGPPTFAATMDRAAGWLCARGQDLATPEGRRAALATLLGDPATVASAADTATRLGSGRLDPHVVITPGARLALTKVQGFTVATAVAPHLAALLRDAAADGVHLTGGGYRTAEGQIERRRANCAGDDGVADDHDIYEKPSEACSPPTARPGSSQHELGLAIDFERCQSRDTPCYAWLARYAHRYGLYNLPVEPWHWSTTGT